MGQNSFHCPCKATMDRYEVSSCTSESPRGECYLA
nr:MAG TPA: cell division protein kinase [Bacteriophage sp.]